MDPLVSVIIPCYNHANYIEKCIESLMNDSYRNKEILIIDDGSNDNSFEIITKYIKDNNLKNIYLKKQENIGITKTLNIMLKNAKGEYITIIASDDIMEKDGIRRRVEYLEKNKNKYAVIGNAYLIDEFGKIFDKNGMKRLKGTKKSNLLKEEKLRKELIVRWSVLGPTLLLRKKTYEIIGKYDETLKIEDRDFYLRLLEKNMLGYIDYNVAYYRMHSTNTCGKNSRKRLELLKEIALTNIKYSNKDFSKIEKLYLKSYMLDYKFLKENKNQYLLLYKVIRKILEKIILF